MNKPFSAVTRGATLSLSVVVLSGCFGSQAPAPAMHYGKKEGAGTTGIHTVSAGETLWSISQRYNIALQDIAVENRLGAPFALTVGQRLNLPPPQQYRVRQGDTLYSVSRLFGVSTSQIASQNSLSAPYTIRAGQTLNISTTARQAAVASASGGAERAGPVAHAPVSSSAGSSPQPVSGGSAAGGVSTSTSGAVQTASASTQPKTKITTATPARSSSRFLRPVSGRVISTYGAKPDGLHNDGINIAAARGTPVKAAENGVVVYAGNELKGSGNLVLIRHEGRWMTAYAHMDSIKVTRGQTIRRGEDIGAVGMTGSVSAPQLHFEVRRGTEAINPELYLDG